MKKSWHSASKSCREWLLAHNFPSSGKIKKFTNSSRRERSMPHLQRAICSSLAPHRDFGSWLSQLLTPQPSPQLYPTAGDTNSCSGCPVSTSKPRAGLTTAAPHTCGYSREQPSQGSLRLRSLVGKRGGDGQGKIPTKQMQVKAENSFFWL